ncbi:unnamed protein product [Mytilus edulis]|uniref:Uncharacterized protein n=1 Tax=Mytilus edulis TaxID=6550 RepID=A0A8S3SVZ2_MYTED|nr:unnamed protein product [Mytilus edulis]
MKHGISKDFDESGCVPLALFTDGVNPNKNTAAIKLIWPIILTWITLPQDIRYFLGPMMLLGIVPDRRKMAANFNIFDDDSISTWSNTGKGFYENRIFDDASSSSALAICDADGIPEKGQKSWATSVFKKMYPVSFISSLPPPPLNTDIAYVIDGMFIINTIPLSVHKTFLDYARFLFDKWVVRPHFQFKATEVHLVFDHPNRQGTSPKDIERSRRDITDQTIEFDKLSPDTDLPSNWRSFLSVRKQKRLLVNFISEHFLTFANQKL